MYFEAQLCTVGTFLTTAIFLPFKSSFQLSQIKKNISKPPGRCKKNFFSFFFVFFRFDKKNLIKSFPLFLLVCRFVYPLLREGGINPFGNQRCSILVNRAEPSQPPNFSHFPTRLVNGQQSRVYDLQSTDYGHGLGSMVYGLHSRVHRLRCTKNNPN